MVVLDGGYLWVVRFACGVCPVILLVDGIVCMARSVVSVF